LKHWQKICSTCISDDENSQLSIYLLNRGKSRQREGVPMHTHARNRYFSFSIRHRYATGSC